MHLFSMGTWKKREEISAGDMWAHVGFEIFKLFVVQSCLGRRGSTEVFSLNNYCTFLSSSKSTIIVPIGWMVDKLGCVQTIYGIRTLNFSSCSSKLSKFLTFEAFKRTLWYRVPSETNLGTRVQRVLKGIWFWYQFFIFNDFILEGYFFKFYM